MERLGASPRMQRALCQPRGLHLPAGIPAVPSVADPPGSWCWCGDRRRRNPIYFLAVQPVAGGRPLSWHPQAPGGPHPATSQNLTAGAPCSALPQPGEVPPSPCPPNGKIRVGVMADTVQSHNKPLLISKWAFAMIIFSIEISCSRLHS